MRDVAHVLNRADEGPARLAQNTAEMARGKVNPALSIVAEMLFNRDYYDAAIRNPNEPSAKQALDTAGHLLKAFEPFSMRALRENKAKGADVGQAARAMIGITPAPAYVTRTSDQQRAMETNRKVRPTPLVKKLVEKKG
jgi:hypothetical protein